MRYMIIPKFVFPIRYYDYVVKNAHKNNVDPFLIFSIIKAESKFNSNAISRSGAKGLMQIMDKTGHWGANELGVESFESDRLFDPQLNIEIGCWYVGKLQNQYEGDIATLLAAYNAGTGNVYKWKNNKQYSLDGITIDYIPFEETRKYIKKVQTNFKIYKYLYGNK